MRLINNPVFTLPGQLKFRYLVFILKFKSAHIEYWNQLAFKIYNIHVQMFLPLNMVGLMVAHPPPLIPRELNLENSSASTQIYFNAFLNKNTTFLKNFI